MRGFTTTILFILATVTLLGCSKEAPQDLFEQQQRKVLLNRGRLIQDLARPANVHAAKIEGVTLVRGLNGNGADEPPSTYQQLVLQDLQRDTEKKRTAKSQIASLDTAIVMLEAIVPPGARKGDRLDVSVKLLPNTEASSLQNGYIEDGELYQYLAVDTIRRGYQLGKVDGFVTLDPDLVEKNSPIAYKQGKIIGGAVVTRSRPIWLEIKEDERTAGVAQRIEDVINKRFSYTRAGYAGKKKVAQAKAGAARINLEVPEEYRDNIIRYVNVVCAISFFESTDELNERIDRLAEQLLVPENSEFASIQLEAIGSNNAKVVDAIERGLNSPNDMVRFNSAITSAYFNLRQDRQQTARILAEFARTNSTLRPASLAILSYCMKTSFDVDAELRKLLSDPNIETRYGAFYALRTRNPSDYMIQGENMANQFAYHCLNCGGAPYVHISQSRRPEIILFNADQIFLQGDIEVEANPRMTIRSEDDEIIVKRYEASDGVDEQRSVGFKLDDVVRAIVEIGGTYPDVVSFLTKAKSQKLIRAVNEDGTSGECPLAIDALPGNRASHFKKVRDIEAIAEREEARAKAEAAAKKPSVWSKMSPSNWFAKKEDAPGEFSLDEFDQLNSADDSDDRSNEPAIPSDSDPNSDALYLPDEFDLNEEE